MELAQTFEMLADAQAELGAVWVLPDSEGCLNFALTEFGEVLAEIESLLRQGIVGLCKVVDGHMRLDTKYFRNNSRIIDLNQEICDVLMMFNKYFQNVADTEMAIKAISEYNTEYTFFSLVSVYRAQAATLNALIWNDLKSVDAMDEIAFAFALLYSMLPEDYFHNAMLIKMDKYRTKIAKLGEQNNV